MSLKRFANQFFRALAGPHKLVLWELSKRRQTQDSKRIIDRYLAGAGLKKLQLGTGRNLMDGWLNTDIYTTAGPDVAFLDGTTKFPLPDACFDYVFSEHMIEHVPYAAGSNLFRESLRVLKPGGKIRIATPNLKKILALYTEGQLNQTQQDYIRWSVDRHDKGVKIYSPAHVINTFMTSWGHRFVYDVASLRQNMMDVGFVNVTEHAPEHSDDTNLRGIELHATEIGSKEMNELETMVLEGTKPGIAQANPVRITAAA